MQLLFDLNEVSYEYPNGMKALEDINIRIYRGERVVILGPNGAGKTTLLKILDALVPPSSGRVKAFDMILDERSVKRDIYSFRRKVGFVFQDPDVMLFSPTVRDDIAFGLLHLGISDEEVKERVERVLDLFGIDKIKDKHPYNLSGGEKRKAAIAAVLSIDPDVLLFDEPTADLDPKSRSELIGIINQLNAEGKTIIIATHDVNAVPDLADRVYVLNKRIIGEGTPREIFSDVTLLKEANLEVPEIFKLFEVLKCFGYNCEELPLSIDEAIEDLTRTVETEGGHIHLHIHEHTHDEIKEFRNKYEHH
ncbi:MAG TPA: ATP-binding cassette domain-containing protein [Candidatus Syntrophoarchaeum butanivorans]|uniref:ATP-binding cassette domain-containing protein n=1 Tax=Candidatus Syntropharchaeum butanivorans TaxID=1839936 RepID=A0A7J2S120_9EURY|nr:ATP-binding cassette domain-containing protein [Candidatus Syntrophoarchaeum butanivorans]